MGGRSWDKVPRSKLRNAAMPTLIHTCTLPRYSFDCSNSFSRRPNNYHPQVRSILFLVLDTPSHNKLTRARARLLRQHAFILYATWRCISPHCVHGEAPPRRQQLCYTLCGCYAGNCHLLLYCIFVACAGELTTTATLLPRMASASSAACVPSTSQSRAWCTRSPCLRMCQSQCLCPALMIRCVRWGPTLTSAPSGRLSLTSCWRTRLGWR